MAVTPDRKDFRRWRESGAAAGFSKVLGQAICAARDGVARALLAVGATPNHVTLAGFLFTCGAGYCLARGASQQAPYFYAGSGSSGWWPAGAALFLVLAGACDMLDGAVARVGHLGSRFGGILDSTLDRLSDVVIYGGCLVHFGLMEPANVTYQVLALAALMNAFLISYTKARAECVVESCTVGYWERGERFAALLIACASGHVPAVLWQVALLPFFTVLRRVTYAGRATAALDAGHPAPPRGPQPGLLGRLQLWRHPRGSIPYDLVTGLNVAYIIVGPWLWPALLAIGPDADPLRRLLAG